MGPRHAKSTNLHRQLGPRLDRRTFLVAGGVGFCGLDLAALGEQRSGTTRAAEGASPTKRQLARSTILIWLSGGVSHIDTWDLKPHAPAEYRGPFQSIATSAPGIRICEHLPHLARQAHHLAVINSLGHFGRGTGDHHAGYYYNLTGHAPDPSFVQLGNNRTPRSDDWPFVGTVVGYKRPLHPYLPQAITLPQMPGAPAYTRPGQFAARLGVEWDPLYFDGNAERPLEFRLPALALQAGVDAKRLQARRALLALVDEGSRVLERSRTLANYSKQQEKAFSLLTSSRTKDTFDLAQESPSVREQYGTTVNGMSMLLARRLVEAGVPFVSVFWQEDLKRSDTMKCASGGGWDTHGNNFHCLREWLLPEFDRAFAALLADLSGRGLLDQTLVMVNSEMGRKPKIGDPRSGGTTGAGRDHWTNAMSVLLAGGGIRGGQVYGSSDKLAEFPSDRPVAPEDVAKTVYHAMSIDDLAFADREGRPVDLLPEGRPLVELF
jgi:hypothetical protein